MRAKCVQARTLMTKLQLLSLLIMWWMNRVLNDVSIGGLFPENAIATSTLTSMSLLWVYPNSSVHHEFKYENYVVKTEVRQMLFFWFLNWHVSSRLKLLDLRASQTTFPNEINLSLVHNLLSRTDRSEWTHRQKLSSMTLFCFCRILTGNPKLTGPVPSFDDAPIKIL